jgi:hypothetical protein
MANVVYAMNQQNLPEENVLLKEVKKHKQMLADKETEISGLRTRALKAEEALEVERGTSGSLRSDNEKQRADVQKLLGEVRDLRHELSLSREGIEHLSEEQRDMVVDAYLATPEYLEEELKAAAERFRIGLYQGLRNIAGMKIPGVTNETLRTAATAPYGGDLGRAGCKSVPYPRHDVPVGFDHPVPDEDRITLGISDFFGEEPPRSDFEQVDEEEVAEGTAPPAS